jgi:hypothetical protein
MFTLAVVASRAIPVTTNASDAILHTIAHEGATLIMVAKEIDFVSPAVVIVSAPFAPGTAIPLFCNSITTSPAVAVVNVVLKVT